MTIKESKRRLPGTAAPRHDLEEGVARFARRVSGVVRVARTSAMLLIAHVPGTMQATRAGARATTTALQALPDSTLRWLVASSVGLGAGFYLAGAPRLVSAAGVAPALVVGAAIVLRPIDPVGSPEANQ